MSKEKDPSEYQECVALSQWLDRHGILYTHVPMGGFRNKREGAILKRIGAKAGVPDYLIFTPPRADILASMPDGHGGHVYEHARGIAIEMKRRGCKYKATAGQDIWIDKLLACGWIVFVACGAGEAVDRLEDMGFGK